jgi:hypothetical protein
MTIHIRPATRDDIPHLADSGAIRSASVPRSSRLCRERSYRARPNYWSAWPRLEKYGWPLRIKSPSALSPAGRWMASYTSTRCRSRSSIKSKVLAAILMLRVLDEAAKANYPGVSLTTRRHAAWNMPFYKKLGFIEAENAQEWPGLFAQLQKEIDSGTASLERCAMIIKLKE